MRPYRCCQALFPLTPPPAHVAIPFITQAHDIVFILVKPSDRKRVAPIDCQSTIAEEQVELGGDSGTIGVRKVLARDEKIVKSRCGAVGRCGKAECAIEEWKDMEREAFGHLTRDLRWIAEPDDHCLYQQTCSSPSTRHAVPDNQRYD